jgi:hypothetical protein
MARCVSLSTVVAVRAVPNATLMVGAAMVPDYRYLAAMPGGRSPDIA